MYKTVQGDTWDIISKKIYGTELQMHVLIVANPAARDVVIFPAGVELVNGVSDSWGYTNKKNSGIL